MSTITIRALETSIPAQQNRISNTVQSQQNNTANILAHASEKMRNIDNKVYLSTLSSTQMCSRTAHVLTCTTTGAIIGAIAGSPKCGLGAGPGAAIGAGVGFAVGIATAMSWDLCNFPDWKKQQKKEVITQLMSALGGVISNKDLICPITQEIPIDPVITPYSNQVYERSHLEQWIAEKGTDPITRKPLTTDQIFHSPAAIGVLFQTCKKITSGETRVENLSALHLEGIRNMQKDFDKVRTNYFKTEEERLMKLFSSNRLTIQEFGAQIKQLADLVDPKG